MPAYGLIDHDRETMMSNTSDRDDEMSRPPVYEVRVKGRLGCHWTEWFEGFTIALKTNGDSLLTGPVVDQAALHGLLRKIRDLGLPLISVIEVEPERTVTTNEDI